jgi:hypothetical protein
MPCQTKHRQADRIGNMTCHNDFASLGLKSVLNHILQENLRDQANLGSEHQQHCAARQLRMRKVRLRSFALQGSPHGVRAAQI